MPYRISSRDEYPTWIGLIFIFNLIVGTGALTLPRVFAKAGWALGLVVIIFLAFISFVTVTFVVETMACANAVMHWKRLQFLKRDRAIQEDNPESDVTDHLLPSTIIVGGSSSVGHGPGGGGGNGGVATTTSDLSDSKMEHTPLFSQRSRYYVLDNKIELSEMAGLFFNDFGRILFCLCIAIYLYGDLSIYSAAVAKSLRDVLCARNVNISSNQTTDSLDMYPCWKDHTFTRLDIYRLTLFGFIMLLGPFTFFNVQKTKYIQILTVILRWSAFTIMISIAIKRLIQLGPQGHPKSVDITGLPSLFGACVYSFMCHHSLPSLLAPINNKDRIKSLLSLDYILISIFYLLLAITGAFAFENLNDLYTLNFVPNSQNDNDPNNNNNSTILMKIIEYFLALFPVFTLSASFPIIAITLRNNLQTLFLDMSRIETYNLLLRRLLFPILAICPPIIVTYFTENITSLVGFTGSYAGAGIQYLIPITLVYTARKTCTDLLGQGIVNEYRSPFKSQLWLIFVFFWTFLSIILVTVNNFA